MRRPLLAALTALLLLAWPASAQLIPTSPGGAPSAAGTERVLMDATVWVTPGEEAGTCFIVGAGQLDVTIRRTDTAEHRQLTSFQLSPFGMGDDAAGIRLTVSVIEQTQVTRVNGGPPYCWGITIDPPPGYSQMTQYDKSFYHQRIAVKITHTPQ